jgi:peptidoglycan/xylan/chitin deacetylase (PgdA/CDA1 family)
MWRRSLKVSGATALTRSGIPQLVARLSGRARRPLLLGYHRVVPEYRPDPLFTLQPMQIDARMLEAHLDWVARRYRLVSIDEAAHSLLDERRNRPLAALTFDDGYRGVYDVAYPLLRRKGIPAALFVVSALVGSREVPLFDRLYYQLAHGYAREKEVPRAVVAALARLGIPASEIQPIRRAACPYDALQALLLALGHAPIRTLVDGLESENPLPESIADELRSVDWDMVTRMADGDITIGSHTRNHVFLTREPASTVGDELLVSKSDIESRLGRPVRHFAYPAGEFNPETVRAVAQAGYEFAYTICTHVDASYPALTIPRRVLWQNSCVDGGGRFSDAVMSTQASGLLDIVSPPCHVDHRTRLGARLGAGHVSVAARA